MAMSAKRTILLENISPRGLITIILTGLTLFLLGYALVLEDRVHVLEREMIHFMYKKGQGMAIE